MLGDGYHDVPDGKLAAVVTSLEMFERPALLPERADPSWTLRHVTAAGTEWYRDLYRRIGAEYLWQSRLRIADAALRAELDEPRNEVRTLHVAGRDEGLLELDFRVANECELTFFGVTPAFVATGAGRWLMNRALERAWAAPIRRFWVHTCSLDHTGAVAFYMRTGFRPFRRQVEIVGDPRLDGVLPAGAKPSEPVIGAGARDR